MLAKIFTSYYDNDVTMTHTFTWFKIGIWTLSEGQLLGAMRLTASFEVSQGIYYVELTITGDDST